MKAFGGNGSISPTDKAGAEHVEGAAVQQVRPTFRKRARKHCQRWWWVHLIILCASVLIIALCLVYVGMPRIAQQDINESTLTFESISFTQPTVNGLTLAGAAQQYSSSIFTPTIDAFNVTMHLVTNGITASDPITQIAMPQIHAHHPITSISVAAQPVPILSYDQVTDFALALLNEPNVTVRMEGNTKLHEGALPVINIKYNSSMTFDGLNGLPGFTMINPKVNLSAPAGTPNLMGTAVIPNPTIVTVELGTVTLDISTEQEGLIGNSTVDDFTLKPGNNELPMTAFVNETLALKSMQPDGMVDLMIIGQTSVYNGVHLPYFEKALKSHTLKVSLNLTQIIGSL